MIDIRELRRDPDRFVAKLARKGAQLIGRDLLQVDAAWRATTATVESLRAEQKRQTGRPSPQELQELARRKELLQKAEAELTELERQRKDLLDRVPNPPADDVPDGGEEDFTVVREVGERPSFNFPVRDHVELADAPGWIDMTRGTKVSGSRFAYRVGNLALLELALYRAQRNGNHGARHARDPREFSGR
jgi:seryl-tRNA synthetase